MVTYNNFEELSGKILVQEDILKFSFRDTVLKYKVRCMWLSNETSCSNDKIFHLLRIGDKIDFCTQSYGYRAEDNTFPECREDDYRALTRVALRLFKLCDGFKEETDLKDGEVKFKLISSEDNSRTYTLISNKSSEVLILKLVNGEWIISNMSLPIYRDMLLKIESILRGLNSGKS